MISVSSPQKQFLLFLLFFEQFFLFCFEQLFCQIFCESLPYDESRKGGEKLWLNDIGAMQKPIFKIVIAFRVHGWVIKGAFYFLCLIMLYSA